MNTLENDTPARRWGILASLLILATLMRLYQVNGPLVDQMYVKQVFAANKARSIAGPPFDLLRNSFDFLAESGDRLRLTEEAPAYTGLLGASYWLFGEREWLGRLWSILATLVALAAFKDLVEREFDRQLALVAALFLAMSPLLIFYGRAVLPDPAMLAAMLATACCYRRYLDDGRCRWLLGAVAAGASAGLFKYYGLIVLLPLADMAWRRHGWRSWLRWDFLTLAAAMILPVAVWLIVVFHHTPNPSQGGIYFLFQKPELLGQSVLYKRLFERFFYKDCGPLVSVLAAVGLWAVFARGLRPRPLLPWTLMGLLFYFLLGPKLERHDYYELLMLPTAALWAGVGWQTLFWGRAGEGLFPRDRRLRWGLAALALTAVVQSPLIMRSKFRQESAQVILAERLKQLTSPSGRVLVVGPAWTQPVVHYCGREGWVLTHGSLDPAWPTRFARYRALGAEYVALYFNPICTAEQRASYLPLIERLPVVERYATGRTRKDQCEYYILSLSGLAPAANGTSP